jgi:hypothetical protein
MEVEILSWSFKIVAEFQISLAELSVSFFFRRKIYREKVGVGGGGGGRASGMDSMW